MYVDKDGYDSEGFWDTIIYWWDTVPNRTKDFENGSTFIGEIGSLFTGSFFGTTITFYDIKAIHSVGNGSAIVASSAKFFGWSIAIFSLSFELAAIWDSNDGNTNGDRVMLTLVEVSEFVAVSYISYIGMTATGAALTGRTFILSSEVLYPLLIVVVVVVFVYLATEATYNYIEREQK